MISFLRSATSSQVRHDMLLLGGLGAIAFALIAAWVWRTPMEWPPEDYGASRCWILRTVSPIFVVGGVYIFFKYLQLTVDVNIETTSAQARSYDPFGNLDQVDIIVTTATTTITQTPNIGWDDTAGSSTVAIAVRSNDPQIRPPPRTDRES